MISVEKIDDKTFNVTVNKSGTTQHKVTVPDDYHQKLTKGRISKEELIKRSFEFLLEREPNTSILRSFDLPVISQYFPEYERAIGV
ncbi:MAG: hypothetical protein ACLFU6_00800 [Candidatus Hydrogenedentota bacterium]